jgi:hypothetical protein
VAARTIAELLKRSPSAIRKRARLLNIKLARSRPGPTARKKTVAFLMAVQHRGTKWTPEEDRRLLDLIKAGKSWVFISANLKRPVKSIRIRLKLLKAKGK